MRGEGGSRQQKRQRRGGLKGQHLQQLSCGILWHLVAIQTTVTSVWEIVRSSAMNCLLAMQKHSTLCWHCLLAGLQAMSRAHRIGQKETVNIYRWGQSGYRSNKEAKACVGMVRRRVLEVAGKEMGRGGIGLSQIYAT